jgi:dienelactone hydrolase
VHATATTVSKDPQVDLIFSLFDPRYIATGCDVNDVTRLHGKIDVWANWCKEWSALGAEHEALAKEAAALGRLVTAEQAYVRAALAFHYGKHLFGAHPDEYRVAHDNMMRCYGEAAKLMRPVAEHVVIPYGGAQIFGWLRRPEGVTKPPVAIILPGLDACKEELHEWSNAFLERGLATFTLDGPGQGEAAFSSRISPDWGKVAGAVIDTLLERSDVDATRTGIVGQSLGAIYAPLAAALEPRLKACVANCGPFNFGPVIPQLPAVSQELFRIRAGASTMDEAIAVGNKLNLGNGLAEKMRCPILIVFGAGDRIVPPSEGELLAKAAGGPVDFVVYPEGNHVCFNIPYKFRPLTADWLVEKLK